MRPGGLVGRSDALSVDRPEPRVRGFRPRNGGLWSSPIPPKRAEEHRGEGKETRRGAYRGLTPETAIAVNPDVFRLDELVRDLEVHVLGEDARRGAVRVDRHDERCFTEVARTMRGVANEVEEGCGCCKEQVEDEDEEDGVPSRSNQLKKAGLPPGEMARFF